MGCRSRLATLFPDNQCDVKEPTRCSKRAVDVVPGGVVYLYLLLYLSFTLIRGLSGWVRSKCGLIVAACPKEEL